MKNHPEKNKQLEKNEKTTLEKINNLKKMKKSMKIPEQINFSKI